MADVVAVIGQPPRAPSAPADGFEARFYRHTLLVCLRGAKRNNYPRSETYRF
jgi:hypothetical protein